MSTPPGESRQYYFLTPGSTGEVKDTGTGVAVLVDELPLGTKPEEFAPKPVNRENSMVMNRENSMLINRENSMVMNRENSMLASAQPESNAISKLMKYMFEKKRKPNLRPVTGRHPSKAFKVDPKIFFAHERTFLAWLHAALLLAGTSIAIMAFSDADNLTSQLYGVFLLPVAISFIFYAMYQYARRASMISQRDNGPFEDRVGPIVLGSILIVSIAVQFMMKLIQLE